MIYDFHLTKLTYIGRDSSLFELPHVLKNMFMFPNEWTDIDISDSPMDDKVISHFFDDNRRSQFVVLQETVDDYKSIYKRLLLYQGLFNYYRVPYVVFYLNSPLPQVGPKQVPYDIILDKRVLLPSPIDSSVPNTEIAKRIFEHSIKNQLVIWEHPLNIYNEPKSYVRV